MTSRNIGVWCALLGLGLSAASGCAERTVPEPSSTRSATESGAKQSGLDQSGAKLKRAEPSGEPNSDGVAVQKLSLPAPTRTRAGSLRFADPSIENPRMVRVLLDRLADTRLLSDEREALVEALPRTGGDWQSTILARYPDERDPHVRQMMVAIMRRAGAPFGEKGVLLGLADADASVRSEAATTASMLKQGAASGAVLGSALARALNDPDVMVRAGAARSLGVLRVRDSFDAIAQLLGDASPEVRLHALRALGRLDTVRARAVVGVKPLMSDADPRVAQAARTLLE